MEDNKIKKLEQGIIIKRKLHEMGIVGIVGPQGERGPKGDKGDSGFASIEIGNVETIEPNELAVVENVGTDENVILDFKIPRGMDGNEGKVGPIGPQGEKGIQGEKGEKGEKGDKGEPGEKGEKGDIGPRGLPGEIGISENIVIDGTETIEAGEEAMVMDDFDRYIHHLTFYIPKGDKGEIGPTGPIGPGAGVTAYNAILFVKYADATDSRSLTIKEKTFIPDPTSMFTVPTTINIDVNTTGIYEITLCGKLSGVTEDNGASFYLWNTVTGAVIDNLTFSLNEGTTSDMTFSGTTVTQIFAPATLQVKSAISNDAIGTTVKFKDINLLIKRFNS